MRVAMRGGQRVDLTLPERAEVVRAGAGPAEPPVCEAAPAMKGNTGQFKLVREYTRDASGSGGVLGWK